MYFNFLKKDYDVINNLLQVKENNIDAANYYIDYLSDDAFHISQAELNEFKDKYPLSTAIIHAINKKMGVDENDENYVRVNANSHIDNLIILDPKQYEDNPYFKLIKKAHFYKDKWFMNTQFYKPYEIFTYDELKVDQSFFKEITPMGTFINRFNYPAIIEDEYIWMSLIPHEINTMKQPIINAHGNVLVFGLGLGYFAYMISLKEEVNHIVIIEKDKNVISLFKQYLLPLFKHKEKIEIIENDAYEYLDNLNKNYDYAFIDIYHNVGDGFPLYVKFKPYEKKFNKTKFNYWIETSLIAMLRRYVLTLYEEKVIYKYVDKDYLKANNNNDRFINKLYFYLKDYEFNSANEFIEFLKDESLKKILINMK